MISGVVGRSWSGGDLETAVFMGSEHTHGPDDGTKNGTEHGSKR